jgi:hypothetical protein
MKKSRLRFLLILIFIILISIVCAYWLTDNNYIEIRSDFLESLLQGSLSIWLIMFLFLKIFIWILESDAIRNRFIIFFPIATILGIMLIMLLIAGIFFTSFNRNSSNDDAIIYKNMANNKEKLIFQCGWAGIGGGSEHWRIVRTNKPNLIIRPILVDTSQNIIRQMELGASYDLKPKFDTLQYKSNNYVLESYLIKESGLINRIKLDLICYKAQ